MAKALISGPSDETTHGMTEEGHPTTLTVTSLGNPDWDNNPPEEVEPPTTVTLTIQGGEQSSQQDGTDSLTSSKPAESSGSTTETESPSPALATENLSAQDPTVSGSASLTGGSTMGTQKRPNRSK
jgi:hypothetical protein